MEEEARKAIVKILCENNNFDVADLENNLKVVASEAYAPFLLFVECLDTKQFRDRNNPFDGFFINMLHRASNTFGGMVSLITTGHLQDAEVLSRTLTESSLTIQFLAKGDSVENISHYLASYYTGQKWKNDKWKTVINETEIHPHHKLIEEKNETENKAKEICKLFIESAGGEWPTKPQPTSVDKMFKALNKEIEYRTVYRAMCDQSHQNQEDLANSLFSSLNENPETEIQSKNAKHAFSIFICLWGVRYFMEALEALGKYYNFETVQKQSKLALEAVDSQHENITHSLKIYKFPSGWANSIVDGI